MSKARRWSLPPTMPTISRSYPQQLWQRSVLPVTADPKLGGLVLDAKALNDNNLDHEANGYLHGMWGFQTLRRSQLPSCNRQT